MAATENPSELERFRYHLAHELKAPARHIAGFAQLLKARLGAGLDEKSQHYLETLVSSSLLLQKQIDALHEHSEVVSQNPRPEQIDTADMVRTTWIELVPRVELRLEMEGLPQAFADRTLLSRVWYELLSNAIHFTRESAKPVVQVSGTVAPEGTFFRVRDNGIGFDSKLLSPPFDVFQRFHPTSDLAGLGIGLATARRIVENHGGEMGAVSEVGRGAEFWFRLPLPETRGSDGT